MSNIKFAWIIAFLLIYSTARCDDHSGSETDTEDETDVYDETEYDYEENRVHSSAFHLGDIFKKDMEFLTLMTDTTMSTIALTMPEFVGSIKCPDGEVDLEELRKSGLDDEEDTEQFPNIDLYYPYDYPILAMLRSIIKWSFDSMILEIQDRLTVPGSNVDLEFERNKEHQLQNGGAKDNGKDVNEIPPPDVRNPFERAILNVIRSTIKSTITSTISKFQDRVKFPKLQKSAMDDGKDMDEIPTPDVHDKLQLKAIEVIRSTIKSTINSTMPTFLSIVKCRDEKAKHHCPPGFLYLPKAKTCYKIVYEEHNWTSAGQRCRDLNPKAHLAAISTENEKTALMTYLKWELRRNSHKHLCNFGPYRYKDKKLWTSGQRVNETICRSPFVWKVSANKHLPFRFNYWLDDGPFCVEGKDHCLLLCTWSRKYLWWSGHSCDDKTTCPLCEYDPK